MFIPCKSIKILIWLPGTILCGFEATEWDRRRFRRFSHVPQTHCVDECAWTGSIPSTACPRSLDQLKEVNQNQNGKMLSNAYQFWNVSLTEQECCCWTQQPPDPPPTKSTWASFWKCSSGLSFCLAFCSFYTHFVQVVSHQDNFNWRLVYSSASYRFVQY